MNAPRLHNELPDYVKNSENITAFKKKLKMYMFQMCYGLDDKTVKPD